MRPTGSPLLFLALAGLAGAQEAVPATQTKTSSRLKEVITSSLPKFTPPPAKPPQDFNTVAPEIDPHVLALPKFTVKEKRPPTHDPDVWLTDKAVQQKAMAAYQQSLTDLEWALNSWYIPLFGSPPSARARASYESRKKMSELQRVRDLFKTISLTDQSGAAELEKERVKMEQTEYWQSRPAGHGRSK